MRSWSLAGAVVLLMLASGPAAAAFSVAVAANPTAAPTSPPPSTGRPTPAVAQPADDLFASAAEVAGLSVVVERAGARRLVAGRDTGYTIGVSNRGEKLQVVRVRVIVPPWMPVVTPHDGGRREPGFVEWPVSVAPGQVMILRMTGTYAAPDRNTPTRVAFTACALGAESNQPIVCATDIARLESGRISVPGWLVALAAGIAVAGAVVVAILRRRAGVGPPAPVPPALR